jgi:eukaryotic-like serine/threonine-protein kinase
MEDDLPYIVMELLDGEDLGARLKRMQRLSLAETAQILLPVARGLERAHHAKLVHRDLKPENIFLVREGDEDVPKILDFGIAKTLVSDPDSFDVTHDGAVLGTPYYMSPEQSRARRDIDHRADLWALGVIIFRMVTGRRPFNGSTAAALAVQICTEPPPPVGSIAPDLPAQLDAFFERALAKEPGHRFQSAREFAQAFAEVAGYAAHLSRTSLPTWSGSTTGPLGLSGSSGSFARTGPTGPPIEPAMGVTTPPNSGTNWRPIAIIAATTVLVLGAGLFLVLGKKANPASQTETSLAVSTNAANPVVSQVVNAAPVASAAPSVVPSAEPTELGELDEPAPADTTVKTTVKSVKPATSARKKPSRDLGY